MNEAVVRREKIPIHALRRKKNGIVEMKAEQDLAISTIRGRVQLQQVAAPVVARNDKKDVGTDGPNSLVDHTLQVDPALRRFSRTASCEGLIEGLQADHRGVRQHAGQRFNGLQEFVLPIADQVVLVVSVLREKSDQRSYPFVARLLRKIGYAFHGQFTLFYAGAGADERHVKPQPNEVEAVGAQDSNSFDVVFLKLLNIARSRRGRIHGQR